MFVETTNQLFQDLNAVMDAALKRDGLAALPAVGRIISAFGGTAPTKNSTDADENT